MNTRSVPLPTGNGLIIERESPVSGEIVSRVAADDLKSALAAAAGAARGFPAWASRSASDRAALLTRTADLIEARAKDLSAVMQNELGMATDWAEQNVSFAAEILRDVASYAPEVDQVEPVPDKRDINGWAERVPCGVCLGIAPWNAPLILGVRSLAAPLLCGNTVLIKGSEFAPSTFRLLGDILLEAAIPQDVARILLTRPEDSEAIVEALIASPVVRRVNFTGSTRVGRRVAELSAKHLKRPLLELGGQATMIVLEDADLDLAAQAALHGGYLNQGQICMSTERLVVAESVADNFVARLEQGRKTLCLGPSADIKTAFGPVISKTSAERLSGLIGDAVSKGAFLVGGGTIKGAFVEPALMDRVEPDMRLYREEVFGPILSVTRVADEREAITVANDSDYGLASAVFGRDEERALNVARQMHTGICHINRATVDDNPHAPFGGVKHSGYGRFGGRWAIHEFTELRWITKPA